MKAGVNKKDEMYNMLVDDDLVKKTPSFAKCTANSDGSFFIQVKSLIRVDFLLLLYYL